MISDRFDRRRTVLKVVVFEILLSLIVALLIATGNMRPWIMFVYMLLSSLCSVLDTTNRPALVYDVLFASGAEHFVGTALSGSISTVLTGLSWICVGIHSRRALPSPVCA